MHKKPLPLTLAGLHAERDELMNDCAEIEQQLGFRKAAIKQRQSETGSRYLPAEEFAAYETWRSGAAAALRYKRLRQSLINAEIKKLNGANVRAQAALTAGLTPADVSDPVKLLRAMRALVIKLMKEGVDFDSDEQALLDMVRECIKQHDEVAAEGALKEERKS